MSTRAGIIIVDKYSKDNHERGIHFYRHSDGYPSGVLPTLTKLLEAVRDGHIRDNTGQASGWLIILGAKEYNTEGGYKCFKCDGTDISPVMPGEPRQGYKCNAEGCDGKAEDVQYTSIKLTDEQIMTPGGIAGERWKVGAYEPTSNVSNHGDLEWVHIVDLEELTVDSRSQYGSQENEFYELPKLEEVS